MLRYTWILLLVIVACAPATSPPPVSGQTLSADASLFNYLLNPFETDLSLLGVVTISNYRSFTYTGQDPNAFIEAVNTFYRSNPGFCPLDDAFYAASNEVQFMTLASDGGLAMRGFLYDQSRRPNLRYAYFEAALSRPLATTQCQTAGVKP